MCVFLRLAFHQYIPAPYTGHWYIPKRFLTMATKRSALYMKVRDQIVADIESGKLKPNESLPSERVLSERFDVSRMTTRHALIQLEKEGFAFTRGTRSRYIAEPHVDYDLSKSISFFASAIDRRTALHISVLERETTVANDEQCRRLGLAAGSDIHVHTRFCRLGSRPAFLEIEFVSAERFPDLWDHDIAQSMSRLFEREYGVSSVRDQITIKQCRFSKEMAKILDVEDLPIGIMLEQTVYDNNDTPISFGSQYWRGDVAHFSADIRYE